LIVECRNAHYLSCSQVTEVTHMQRHSASIPLIVALIVAVVGQGIILLNDFGPGNHSHGNGMIAAAAVARAGAIEIPVDPGNHRHGTGTTTAAAVARAGAIEIPVGPGNHPHGTGTTTAAAVAKAGAIEIPVGP
jgi:hypothetical protein